MKKGAQAMHINRKQREVIERSLAITVKTIREKKETVSNYHEAKALEIIATEYEAVLLEIIGKK